MSDTADDYKLIDPSKLDWENAQLYTPRPSGQLDENDRRNCRGYGVLRVIFTDNNVRFIEPIIEPTAFYRPWVGNTEVPAFGAIIKWGDSFYGSDLESFERMYTACQLIDPEALDWEHAPKYRRWIDYERANGDGNYDDDPRQSPQPYVPRLGPPEPVIFADRFMHWPSPNGETVIVHRGYPIIRTVAGDQIIPLDREVLQTRYFSPDMLAEMAEMLAKMMGEVSREM
jgi:hypothetical protein